MAAHRSTLDPFVLVENTRRGHYATPGSGADAATQVAFRQSGYNRTMAEQCRERSPGGFAGRAVSPIPPERTPAGGSESEPVHSIGVKNFRNPSERLDTDPLAVNLPTA